MNCHRTGFGFDSHSFDVKGTLILGGVSFPGVPRLKGHSDGDVLLHALIDALLGGAGLGDIGEMFPDTSKKTKNISSKIMLANVLKKVKAAGFNAKLLDLTVVAERPRLSPVKIKIRKNLAHLLHLPVSAINIKGKTPEGLSIFSRPEEF